MNVLRPAVGAEPGHRFGLPAVAARFDRGALALLALPWLVLLADPLWAYPGFTRDGWAYFGAFQDLPAYLKTYSHYSCGRLTALVPGWVAYAALPPRAANLALHVGVYSAGVLAGYALLRGTVGRRAGLLAMVAMGGHFFFLRAAGWDYLDAYAIAYFLMAGAAAAAAGRPGRRWRAWALAAGAAAAALVTTYLAFVVLLPFLAGLLVLANRVGGRHSLEATGFWVTVGFVGTLAAVAVVSKALGGPALFLLPSFTFIQSFGPQAKASNIHAPAHWLPWATWLLLPAAAAAGAVAWVLRAAAARRVGGPFAAYFQAQLLVLGALLWVAQLRGDLAFLQHRAPANATVMVAGFLALAGQWAGWLGRLSPGQFRRLAAAWAGVTLLAAADPARLGLPDWGRWVPPAAALGCGVAAAALAQFGPARVTAGVAVAALLAAVGGSARTHFRMNDAIHGIDSTIGQERYEEFDPLREKSYRAIAEAADWSRRLAPTGKVWFWYNLDDPLGPVYDMAAHTNFHYFQVVNVRFPDLSDGKVYRGEPVQTIARAGGGAVVVFSDRPDAAERALYWLRGCGMTAELEDERVIGRAPVALRAVVIRVAAGP